MFGNGEKKWQPDLQDCVRSQAELPGPTPLALRLCTACEAGMFISLNISKWLDSEQLCKYLHNIFSFSFWLAKLKVFTLWLLETNFASVWKTVTLFDSLFTIDYGPDILQLCKVRS